MAAAISRQAYLTGEIVRSAGSEHRIRRNTEQDEYQERQEMLVLEDELNRNENRPNVNYLASEAATTALSSKVSR